MSESTRYWKVSTNSISFFHFQILVLEKGEAIKNAFPGIQPEADTILRVKLTKQQWVVQVDTLAGSLEFDMRKICSISTPAWNCGINLPPGVMNFD